MGRFETENQMRDATMMEQPKEGGEVRRPIYTNYLKKGAGAHNQQMRRKEFRARRGDELRGLLGREVLGGQQLMLTQQQFGAQPGLGLPQQSAAGTRGIESRLLSKPPLRHWGYEPALVRQADIDQAPNFKRRVRVQRERAQRIHRVRRGVAWDIPVYDRERHEKGGLAWTIPMDSDMYEGSGTSSKKKSSKSKSLLKRFTAGVKRAFKGHRATTKQPKVTVRPQQRLMARQRGAAFIARSQVPPQAPIVEKKRLRKTENTTGVELRKQEAFARAPGVVGAGPGITAAPVVEDRGMLVNGRRIHTTHLSEVPLMRQAPALDKDDSAQKVEAPRTAAASHAAPVAHTKGHAITAQHEQRLQHVRTG